MVEIDLHGAESAFEYILDISVEQADAVASRTFLIGRRCFVRPRLSGHVDVRPADVFLDESLDELSGRNRATFTRADILHVRDGESINRSKGSASGMRQSWSPNSRAAVRRSEASSSLFENRPAHS